MFRFTAGAVLALAAGLAAPAAAEDILRGSASDLVTFERWCLDIAKYTESRCDQRLRPDYDEFAVYRDSIERFEWEFLRELNASRELRHRVETQDNLEPTLNLE